MSELDDALANVDITIEVMNEAIDRASQLLRKEFIAAVVEVSKTAKRPIVGVVAMGTHHIHMQAKSGEIWHAHNAYTDMCHRLSW